MSSRINFIFLSTSTTVKWLTEVCFPIWLSSMTLLVWPSLSYTKKSCCCIRCVNRSMDGMIACLVSCWVVMRNGEIYLTWLARFTFDVVYVPVILCCPSRCMGYAACSYLRFLDEIGGIHVVFMLEKCRVVPFKPVLSVVCLELIAAVLCVQLEVKLRRELPLQYDEYFWTDSMVVLAYIKNVSSRFKVFVANRVKKIHDGSRPDQWFHISSANNPADDSLSVGWQGLISLDLNYMSQRSTWCCLLKMMRWSV